MVKKIALFAGFLSLLCMGILALVSMRYASSSLLFNASTAFKYLVTKKTAHTNGIIRPFKDQSGWYFLRNDLGGILLPWKYFEYNADAIVAVNDSLRKRAINLVVVPVPDREMIIQKYSRFSAATASNQRKRFIAILKRKGVHTIDLAPIYSTQSQKELLYRKGDTHWDEPGIILAAKVISSYIDSNFSNFARHDCPMALKDTMIFLQDGLSAEFEDSALYPAKIKMVSMQNNAKVVSSAGKDILVFGDSYAGFYHGYKAGLGDHIAYNVGLPTRTESRIFASASGPTMIRQMLQNREHLPKLIVWVFITRHLFDAKFEHF